MVAGARGGEGILLLVLIFSAYHLHPMLFPTHSSPFPSFFIGPSYKRISRQALLLRLGRQPRNLRDEW